MIKLESFKFAWIDIFFFYSSLGQVFIDIIANSIQLHISKNGLHFTDFNNYLISVEIKTLIFFSINL